MKAENKHSIMVWSIVVLAIMNITTLATIMYHQHQTAMVDIGGVTDQKQLEADAEKFSGRYFRDQLNLSNEQMDHFRNFNPVFRQQARAITIELSQHRKQMLIELDAIESDTIKLNTLSDSIGLLHRDLKKLTYRYYLDIKSLCNNDQQKKLEQLFSQMFTNDSPMGFPGGPNGRQNGKRFNNK